MDAASYPALWDIYSKTGIRPEWLLPGLDIESGLNPSLPNEQGYPYYGINQISASFLQARGIDPSDYLTWPASRQLSEVVAPYMQGQVSEFGPLTSGVRVYQANFYPASLRTATQPDDAIVCAPSSAYEANRVLDYNHDGCITPSDLAVLIGQHASTSRVQRAISNAYAAAPNGVGGPTDPVWGTGGSGTAWYKRVSKSEWALIAAAAGGLAGAVYVAKEQRLLPAMSTAEAAEEPYHPVAAAAIVEGVWLLIGAGIGGLAAGGTGARVGAIVGGALAAPGAYAAYKQRG